MTFWPRIYRLRLNDCRRRKTPARNRPACCAKSTWAAPPLTGINAPVGYADVVTAKLAEFSGVPVVEAGT